MDEAYRPRPRWWSGQAGLRWRAVAVAGGLLTCGVVIGGCFDYETKPFKCGHALVGDRDVAQSCSEPHQVCVCATNDCAERVDPQVTGCASKLRYVAAPFAAADAGDDARCVPVMDASWLVKEDQENRFCSAYPPEGGEGGSGAGQTSGGAGSESGTGGAP